MSQSVLILDTPNSCFECPLCIDNTCIKLEKTVIINEDYTERSKECPLKNLPQKTVCSIYNYGGYENGRSKGWNDYYDMLTKGVLGTMD